MPASEYPNRPMEAQTQVSAKSVDYRECPNQSGMNCIAPINPSRYPLDGSCVAFSATQSTARCSVPLLDGINCTRSGHMRKTDLDQAWRALCKILSGTAAIQRVLGAGRVVKALPLPEGRLRGPSPSRRYRVRRTPRYGCVRLARHGH